MQYICFYFYKKLCGFGMGIIKPMDFQLLCSWFSDTLVLLDFEPEIVEIPAAHVNHLGVVLLFL